MRIDGLYRIFGLVAAILCVGLPASQAATVPSAGLVGTVKSSDGKPMEGVAISARAQDKTFTTSVYTNHDGEYFFPVLADGKYRIWAQAVGFEASPTEQTISSGKKVQQDFTLKPLQDFQKQLSGTEWVNSLPDDTPEDRRMKNIFFNHCTECHTAGFVLAKRFDAAGWTVILNTMINSRVKATPREIPARGLIETYKSDLVEYLTRVRGPKPSPMQFKPLPRATGEATGIVVTEYDVPLGDPPDHIMVPSAADWSEGIASRYEGYVLHDAVVGNDGSVYFSDPMVPERTVGKLDPKTGHVTNYKLPDKDGFALSTHGAMADKKGNIWFTNPTEGTILRFDPQTGAFQRYPKPSSLSPTGTMNAISIDSKGIPWASEAEGGLRLNPETGAYTEHKELTSGGYPYGITLDSEDNAWFAEIDADRLGVANGSTGEVDEVVLPPLDEEISAKDREIGQTKGATSVAAPIYMKGPRRLGADRNGDTVWVAEFWAGRLATINIHTKKITEYKVPSRYSHPYDVVVDKNHMVWFSLLNSDRIAKFNPFTKQFTEYVLPSLGTAARCIDVDDSADASTVWVSYSGVNKIARVQLRTSSVDRKAASM